MGVVEEMMEMVVDEKGGGGVRVLGRRRCG
jgi:hypothetical protein